MDRDFPVVGSSSGSKVGEVLRVRCRTCPSRFAGLCSCFENQRSSYAGVNVLLIEDDGMVILDQHLQGVIERAENMERAAAAFVGRAGPSGRSARGRASEESQSLHSVIHVGWTWPPGYLGFEA